MKKHILRILGLAVAVVGMAQIIDYRVETFSGVQEEIDPASSVTPTNSVIRLGKQSGMSIWATVSSEAAATGNVTFRFAPSYDGTNFSTTTIDHVVVLSGTNVLTGWTNLPPSALGNVRFLRLQQISNSSASNVVVHSAVAGRYLTP